MTKAMAPSPIPHSDSRLRVPGTPRSVRRVAIFRALYLGDLLCATPALRALRERFPRAEMVLIGLPWARELVERLSYLDRLDAFPGYPGILEVPYQAERTRAFLATARERGYDLALQMHGDGRISNGFVAELGARLSLGYRQGADGRLTASLPHEPDCHETLRWLRLVATLGARTDDWRPDFPTTPEERDRAAALLSATPPAARSCRTAYPAPRIGLHPGAKDAARRWPPACFAALADALASEYDARIVLTGNEDEREVTGAVRRAMRSPALDLAGETDLGTFAAVVARLDLLVTNDTGASHLAAAAGTPSVVLFGPSRPAQWAPLDQKRHRPIDAQSLAVRGTDGATALRQLPVAPVLAACADALARKNECGG